MSIDDASAASVINSYRKLWADHKEALSLEASLPETVSAFQTGYPFHPEVLEVVTSKTATLGNFQRVRGMLRILGRAIAQLWRDRPPMRRQSTCITSTLAMLLFIRRSLHAWGSRFTSQPFAATSPLSKASNPSHRKSIAAISKACRLTPSMPRARYFSTRSPFRMR